MTVAKLASRTILVLLVALLTGCAGSGSVHYGAYYDPYPYWGHGGNTTVIVNNPGDDRDRERPSKPPSTNPPGGVGRPKSKARRR